MEQVEKYSKLAKKLAPDILKNQRQLVQFTKDRPLGMTGQTTAHLLGFISVAMKNPMLPVKITCEPYQTEGQILALGGSLEVLHELIKTLNLDYFEISRSKLTLTYKPYTYLTVDKVSIN